MDRINFFLHINIGDTMHEYLDIIVRSLVSIVVLFAITHLLGKKQIANLTLYDYIISLAIGGIVAETIISLDYPLMNGVIALFIFGIVGLIVSFLSMKFHKMSRFFNGEPIILFQNGKFLKRNMWKTRITVDKFLELCRINNCYDIEEISYALLETSGDLSILLKSEYQPVKPKQINIKPESTGFSINLVLDGKIIDENLETINRNEKWLLNQLKNANKNLNDLLLVTIDQNEKIHYFEINKDKEKK